MRAGSLISATTAGSLLLVVLLDPASARQGSVTADATIPVLEPGDVEVPEPAEGQWLEDEQGLEYTLFRWARHEGYYRFEDAEQRFVILRYGLRLRVERHDDEWLVLRWYRSPTPSRQAAEGAARAVDETERPPRLILPEQDRLLLEPWDAGLPRKGQWRNGFAIADFDGDGHLDVAHGPPRKGPDAVPVIFLGSGDGSWRRWSQARFPALHYDYGDVAAGDLDRDGVMDLALAMHNLGLVALRGDGKGEFASWSRGLPRRQPGQDRTGFFSSRAIALADWNRDGRLDLFALAEGPSSARDLADGAPALGKVIFLNDLSGDLSRDDQSHGGEGAWRPVQGPGAMLGDAILPVDLDGDGILDFVTDSRVAGSAELLNFGLPSGSWRVAALPDPLPSLRVRAVAVADFDADGRRDLAIGYNSRSLAGLVTGLDVFLATGNPAAWRKVAIWTEHGTVDGISALAAGDLDGDGDVDLAAASAAGDTLLWLNDGTGGFAGELSPELRPGPEHQGCQGYAVAVRDLDGDGRSELMVAFAGEPGSEALLMGAVAPRCVAEGALRVWKVASAPSVPAGGWYR